MERDEALILIGSLCAKNCNSLATFQEQRHFNETIQVLDSINSLLPQIHKQWGFHGGILRKQIAVDHSNQPTLLAWGHSKQALVRTDAYAAINRFDYSKLMDYDYFALIWVLADCVASEHGILMPPSLKFGKLLHEGNHTAIHTWMDGINSTCSGWKWLDREIFKMYRYRALHWEGLHSLPLQRHVIFILLEALHKYDAPRPTSNPGTRGRPLAPLL